MDSQFVWVIASKKEKVVGGVVRRSERERVEVEVTRVRG